MPRFALRSTYVQALAGSFECFAFASRSALRFYCGVLRSAYACLAFLLECFMFVLRLLFDAQHQTGRLAICFVPIPRGSGSPFVRSRGVVRLSGFVGSLRDGAVLLRRFACGSRLSFFSCQEKRDGLRCAAFLFRTGRDHLTAFSKVVRLSSFVGSLRD